MSKLSALQTLTFAEEMRDDKERLLIIEQAIALAKAELQGLHSDADDLAYVAEVLRVGVQERLHEIGESSDAAGDETGFRLHH